MKNDSTTKGSASGNKKPMPFGKALKCAFEGLVFAFSTQRNFKIHFFFAVLACVLGFLFQIDANAWLAIILCIVAVLALETLNTALEQVVDLASPKWHELAKRSKDCAAAAVLIAAIGSLVVAAVIFMPVIFERLGC